MGETIALQAYATPCQMITSFVVIFQPFLKVVVYDDKLEIFFNRATSGLRAASI